MILWTIQPEEVYELIQRTGVYHCDYRCTKTHTRYRVPYKASSMLFDISMIKDNDEFAEILGYINTKD